MGKQASFKKLRQSGRGFKGTVVVAGDHNKHLVSGMVSLCLNDDYTNHNILIADHYSKNCSQSSNIILVLDKNTNCLAEIMPNEQGSIPWEEYRKSQQLKQVLSKDIATVGMKLNSNDPISYSTILSTVAQFVPIESSIQILSLIRTGASNGMKWIILKDDSGNIRCCLHPDDIKHWNNLCA